jgi:hypothetical protein
LEFGKPLKLIADFYVKRRGALESFPISCMTRHRIASQDFDGSRRKKELASWGMFFCSDLHWP